MLGNRQTIVLGALTSAAVVGTIHRFGGGVLLTSRIATLAVWALAWIGFVALVRGTGATSGAGVPEGDRRRDRVDRATIGIAVLGGCLVAATYLGNEIGIGGDYRMHRMYAYQLLNGFEEAHEPYRGVAGHYPFLVHTLLALGVHATGLTVHYAMALLGVGTSVAVALTAVRAGRHAGLGPLGAHAFAGLLVAWGGAWTFELREFQLYLPAIQLSMPFLARNLALLELLLYIELALQPRAERGGRDLRMLSMGLVVGLLALTRPFDFALAMAGLLALAAVRRTRDGLAGVALALGLAAVYFAPLAARWLDLGIHASREVGKAVDWPTSPGLLLPLAPLVGVGLGSWRRMPPAVRAAVAALAVLAAVPAAGAAVDGLALGERLGLEGGLLKLERVGQVVALCWYAVAAFGLERAAVQLGAPAGRAMLAVILLLGAATTLRADGAFLDGSPRLPSPRWTRSPRYVRDLAGSPLYLRHRLGERRAVVLVPAALGHVVASRNGVEVAWSHRAAPIWASATTGALPEQERRAALDAFYAQLGRGVIDGGLLERLDARHFVWTSPAPAALPTVTELGPIGSFEGIPFHLLRVEVDDEGASVGGRASGTPP